MSFKEVKELRQAGKINEAYALGRLDLEKNTEDIWNKRSLAWVLYDYLKQASSENNVSLFIGYLRELAQLHLPESETMVFDNTAWQIGKIVFTLHKQEKIDYTSISTLFDLVKVFHFTKPSDAYSFLYKAFHKGHKDWERFIEFANWWNFVNFRPEDYDKEELPDGKSVMSLVEQAYIAYAKALLEAKADFQGISSKEVNKDLLKAFLPKLDIIIDNHPEYQYPSYFKAKILLAIGDESNVLSSFLPFAKKKRNDFWVWDLMADIFPHNEEKQLACLCKALSCKTPDEFLINTREKLAEFLIKRQDFNEAKTEIEAIIKTTKANAWNMRRKVLAWTETNWFKSATSNQNNSNFYRRYTNLAEEILFSNIPEEIAVVEFVNKDKKILNFIVSKEKFGFFKYDRFLKQVEIGDILAVRFDGAGQENRYNVLSVKPGNTKFNDSLLKEFSGKIKVNTNQGFGFVEDVFIEPKLIERFKLENESAISGKALISFNKKKNSWAWKAFKVNT